jgi:hypothetical protein
VMVNNSTISTKRTTTSDLSSLNNKKDHDIWLWICRCWIGTGTNKWKA